MGATENLELGKETLEFMANKSRDQDVMYFFRGLNQNTFTVKHLANFFFDHYDVVGPSLISNSDHNPNDCL